MNKCGFLFMISKIDESTILYKMATSNLIVILLLLHEATATMDGCMQCAIQGNCLHAYQNSSGKLCRILLEGTPCCCGIEATCIFDNTGHCGCQSSVAQLGEYKDIITLAIIVVIIMIVSFMIGLVGALLHRNAYQPIA